ncbi:hypothetical protein ACI8AV_06570 [Geodermatophilus sp. SYSU D00804]
MRAGLAEHLGSRQVGRVVYGSIIGLALVVAVERHPPAPGVVAVWLLGTAVAVGLAEVYSDVVGAETRARRRVTRPEVVHMTEDAGAVGFGVVFPAVFFLLAAIGVLATGTAFTLAKWSGVGLIGSYGYWGVRLAGGTPAQALVRGALVAVVGAGLVVLKALVH